MYSQVCRAATISQPEANLRVSLCILPCPSNVIYFFSLFREMIFTLRDKPTGCGLYAPSVFGLYLGLKCCPLTFSCVLACPFVLVGAWSANTSQLMPDVCSPYVLACPSKTNLYCFLSRGMVFTLRDKANWMRSCVSLCVWLVAWAEANWMQAFVFPLCLACPADYRPMTLECPNGVSPLCLPCPSKTNLYFFFLGK